VSAVDDLRGLGPAASRPAITPAQITAGIVAGVPIVANLLAAFGVFVVTPAEQHALTTAVEWAVPFGGLLILGDSHLRGKRNDAEATKAAAVTAAVLANRPAAAPGPGSTNRAVPPPTASEWARAAGEAAVGVRAGPPPTADDDGPGDPDSVPHVIVTAPGRVPADEGDAGPRAIA
jgi:hypothetical protein